MYIELRSRSAFSFLRGSSLPEDLIDRAAALGYPAVALGDRDGLYGAPRFHKAAQAAGLRALIGCELRLDAHHPERTGETPALPSPENSKFEIRNSKSAIYLLAASRTGYENLCRLLTRSKLRAPKGEALATWHDLEGHTAGLFCLAGGAGGPFAGALRRGDSEAVDRTVRRLRALFGADLYVDLQRHLDPAAERLNRALHAIAERYRIPIVATNDVCHAAPDGRRLHDVLTCIREKTVLDSAGRLLWCNAERHLKSPAAMAALFRDLPEAIANTERIAERCEFTLANLGYRFPDFPVPAGETAIGFLRRLTHAGARGRYGRITPRVRRQLEHELALIEKLELSGYFLIVWDIVRYCRERGILAQGRGSAANSAVCYSLGITAVDPIGMDLLFERFLSAQRGEWPDIDVDLPSGDLREEVIQYVYRRYGERGAAMTANVITYRLRSAVREVGKALGFSLEQVDRLAKLLRRFEFTDDSDALAKQLAAGGVDADTPRVRLLVDLVERIQRLPRHLGQHSGGMVMAAGCLDEVVPLEPAAMPGRVVVQWDKDDCADLGIIKVDLLGLGMMAVLQDAIPLVREHEGIELDMAKLPPDDPAVYRMLQRADTIGVFQVESRAQMATLPRMKPRRFYDLVVEVAIIRPGPIVGQMVHPYLRRRAGREKVTYPHPLLEPILKRTLGVPLFQEQLLRIAMEAAGFSGGEAEELRRAMGFKRSMERMQAIERRLRDGMARKGIAGQTADDIVRGITSFALYGFPESHAASFALIAYASAYLKVHHPAVFYCALLNNFPMGFYHPATLVKDAQRHGVRVLPVDATRSGWLCMVERDGMRNAECGLRNAYFSERVTPASRRFFRGGEEIRNPKSLALRLGLKYVAGLREAAGKKIEEERRRAPFESLDDVAYRCGLRDDELAMLAEIGAFASLGLHRREALWQAAALPRGALFEQSRRRQAARVDVSDSIPRTGRTGETPALPSNPKSEIRNPKSKSPLPEMSLLERTLADYRGTGVTVGPHVMRYLRDRLRRQGVLSAAELKRAGNGRWVKIAGLVIVRQRPGTAKGMCFLTLEDETGTSNAAVMPQVFQENRTLIHTAALLLVEGPLQNVENVIHVLARRFAPLSMSEQLIRQRGHGYRLRTTPEEKQPLPKSHDFR